MAWPPADQCYFGSQNTKGGLLESIATLLDQWAAMLPAASHYLQTQRICWRAPLKLLSTEVENKTNQKNPMEICSRRLGFLCFVPWVYGPMGLLFCCLGLLRPWLKGWWMPREAMAPWMYYGKEWWALVILNWSARSGLRERSTRCNLSGTSRNVFWGFNNSNTASFINEINQRKLLRSISLWWEGDLVLSFFKLSDQQWI